MKRKDFSSLKIETQKEKEVYFEHEEFIAGTAPFLRGVYPTMYLQKPLETRILVNISSPEKCNIFIKEKILNGFKNFNIHFNLNHNKPFSENENCGIQISSLRDIKEVFKDINLQNLRITILPNSNTRTILTLLILGLKELNTSIENLNLSIQLNNPNNSEISLTEFIDTSEDIVSYCNKNILKLNSIEISNSFVNEIESPETELANLLLTSYYIIQKWLSKNKSIDTIAPKISFNLKTDEDPVIAMSKTRAARMLWSKMIHLLNPKSQDSYALKLHTTVNDFTNVLPAIFGGYQSLTAFEITQLFALEETNITKTVDPWAGSNYLEKKTEEITGNAWHLFEEKKNLANTVIKHTSNNDSEIILQQLFDYKEIKNVKFSDLITKSFEKNATLEAVFKAIYN